MKILVVEDDAAINKMVTSALIGAGYSAVGAYSGSEALLLLPKSAFQCVILDLMLPGENGETVLSELRKSRAVPVIVLSARVDKESKLSLLSMGADDYITKPFDVDELLARVAAQLRRFKEYGDHERLDAYLDIRLDAATMEATVGGANTELTLKEFQILKLLLSNPTQVFSRSQIYENVWGGRYVGDDKTVNVHISNLRAKLAAHSPHKHIKTVWGVGFRLAE
jgi:DNA-binding response OmpR family regulator